MNENSTSTLLSTALSNGDEYLRESVLAALSEIETARNAIASSAGDAEKLDQAIGYLEVTFTRLTGLDSTRSAGQTYAGHRMRGNGIQAKRRLK